MNKVCDFDKDYPIDTLGYHYKIASVVFPENSAALAYLRKKADESPSGWDEEVVAHESQVVYILREIHNKGSF